MTRVALLAAAVAVLIGAPTAADSTCGDSEGSTMCLEGHICCAIDSGDMSGWCCPARSHDNKTAVRCAFGIDGLGAGRVRLAADGGSPGSSKMMLRNCCDGHPVCGVGVGGGMCCMGPASRIAENGCSAYGEPVCCHSMCGDELCDKECQALGGQCTSGTAAEGGRCFNATSDATIRPPRRVRLLRSAAASPVAAPAAAPGMLV